MLDKQYVDSIYYSFIKGKYRVSEREVAEDIERVESELSKEKKEPSRELIAEKLKEMYKDKSID